jgi:hypothetical protein
LLNAFGNDAHIKRCHPFCVIDDPYISVQYSCVGIIINIIWYLASYLLDSVGSSFLIPAHTLLLNANKKIRVSCSRFLMLLFL